MWASKGVRKCAILYYKEVLYEPVMPETKRQGKEGFVFHIFFTCLEEPFFLKPCFLGNFLEGSKGASPSFNKSQRKKGLGDF